MNMRQKHSGTFSGIRNFFSFFDDNPECDYNSKAMLKYIDERKNYRDELKKNTEPKSYLKQFSYICNLDSVHTTNRSILPGWLGQSLKNVIVKLGNPTYTFIDNDITVIIYKWKFNKVKDKCEVHFYKGKAFLVLHNYQSSAAEDQFRIAESITKKYLSEEQRTAGCLNSQIVDKNHNRIFIDSTIGLKVIYLLNNNSEWFIDMVAETNCKKVLKDEQIEYLERRFVAML